MKNIIRKITFAGLVLFGMLGFALSVHASTVVTFSPLSIKAVKGKSFDVVVNINPNGINNYAEKIEVDYPADILEVKNFTLANKWMPLPQDGYDLIDNTKGVLVKTAGYPGGINSANNFGTITFVAKKTGAGDIKVSGIDYESNSQTSINESKLSFVVNAYPTSGFVEVNSVSSVKKEIKNEVDPASIVSTDTISKVYPELQTASAYESLDFKVVGNWLLGIGVVLVIIAFLLKGKDDEKKKEKK